MTPQKAFVYCRISDDKTGEALGVQRQEQDCRAMAQRDGFEVAEVFVDNDISAYSGKSRPRYSAMLTALAEGRASRVYCWAEDRLHRRPVELEEYITLVGPRNIQTHMVQAGEYDLVTPEGQFRAGVMGQVARFESARKAQRVKRAQEQKIRAGGWTGGTRPFGWQFENQVPVLDPVESELLRVAFRHVLTGGSLGSVVSDWNARSITTSVGKQWGFTQLRQVLLRARNAGLAEWKGDIVGSSQFPAIVSEDIWRATAAILRDPARRRSQSNKAKHLLSGIARCHCGSAVRSATITGRNGEKHPTYRCPEAGTGHVGKRIEQVDAAVTDSMLRWLSTAQLNGHGNDHEPELANLDVEAMALRKRLDDVAIEAADGVLTMSQLRTMTERINLKLRAVESRMVVLQADKRSASAPLDTMRQADSDAATLWSDSTIDQRRTMIRQSFDVTLHPHRKGSSRRFDPDTVTVYPKGYLPGLHGADLAIVRKKLEEGP
ncbi:recombinase family protein [Paenarthrobacter nitroguajacolicus]|uniref:recombinase family protein n=1 Tax=Paenarthrobacter nitroguajacolicus TaxID=211146 RepID=UPI0028644686|nr:recombinase family protein [Paenarthrobacter nitroguajacolicus]MDR6637431.1 DNA invertase Pin-like site-specific DNA recombinase [Paenarthrobacter nitroguajacolicus]